MPREPTTRSATAMNAHASLATEQVVGGTGGAVSRVRVLRSHAPLVLRPTLPKGREPLVQRMAGVARVSLAMGAAGPLGGDDFALDIHVGAGSTLVLNEISATLLLPGARGGRSRMRIAVTVDEDATFVWLPQPVIAAQGCDHVHEIDITLAADARLFMRDELLLGRHREQPGQLTQHLRVRRAGRSLFRQTLALGGAARGWQSPAVLGSHKCVGSVLVVDPAWNERTPAKRVLGCDAALLSLEGPAVLVSALADDTLTLRRQLEHGVSLLGAPWAPEAAPVASLEPVAADPRRAAGASSVVAIA
ncbi:MAG TPA: urease accessory protein UreD [Burkholderiales bacterium]|nr:urease accessory protein UreD [Burkholderiales bacterium]